MALQNAADRASFRVTANQENGSLASFFRRVLSSIHYHKDRVLMSAQKHSFSPFLKKIKLNALPTDMENSIFYTSV